MWKRRLLLGTFLVIGLGPLALAFLTPSPTSSAAPEPQPPLNDQQLSGDNASESRQFAAPPVQTAPGEPQSFWAASAISAGSLLVSLFGTTSMVIFGWRSERRNATESKLRIQHLELQLAAMQGQALAKSEAVTGPAAGP